MSDDRRLPEPSAICRQRTLIAQLDIPVREIDEVLPEIMLGNNKGNLHEWPPLWSLRFADQAHVRFTRKPVAFARIARDAGANHVFPSRGPAAVARDDVIQIKVTPIEEFATVPGRCSCRAQTRCVG